MGQILFGLLGLALIAIGAYLLRRSAATRHWQQVAGEVVEVSIFKHGSQRETPTYSAHLHYLYVFNGVVQRGARALGGSVTSRANAERFGAPYPTGQRIDVFVDPRHPHRHTLQRGLNPHYWWLVGLGLFWLGAAGWVIVD